MFYKLSATLECAAVVLMLLCNVSRGFIRQPSSRVCAIRGGGAVSRLSMFTESEPLKIEVKAITSYDFSGDLLAIPFYKPVVGDSKDDKVFAEGLKAAVPAVSDGIKAAVGELIDEMTFKADVASKQMIRLVGVPGAKYVALAGLGPDPKDDKKDKDMEVQSAFRLGRQMMALAKETKAENVGLVVPPGMSNAGLAQFVLGMHDASYEDKRFRKVPEGGHPAVKLSSVTLLGCSEAVVADIALTYKLSSMIGSGVAYAKDLVGAPANSKTPLTIAESAKQLAADFKLEIKVLGEAECKELGMGGYLGVQQGSMFPPQFVHLTYTPDSPAEDLVKVALVGKGLTFDSGGYNLKAGAGSMIEMMKFDMGGCAAVLGTAKAIAQLRPKNVEVHFITALCENMISAEAMRPGDVLVASNGKTIEVGNTDAEGRLTLADALVYADRLGVDTIVDLATLTGACIVGLGDKLAGLFSPDDTLRAQLEAAAKRTNEGIWALPMERQYKDSLKSPIADLKNIGGRGGGSITAALFLEEFVEKAKWAHIDMAGPVWDNASSKPTGYGVKLLVDFLLNAKKAPSSSSKP